MQQSYKNSQSLPSGMQGSTSDLAQRVPAMDWDRPPWNRWAFQHISQLLSTAPIQCNREFTSPFQVSHQNIETISFERDNGIKTTVNKLIDDTYTDGLLIIHNDNIIHESYYNGMQPHTLHLGQSVSKSIVATAASVLMDQGLLDSAAPVTEYLPELSNTAWRGASVQHVMDMSTGVRYNETYDQRDSDMGKTDVACGWKPAPPGLNTHDWPTNIWDQLLTLTTIEADHGSRFLYRSIETEVLGFIMERVSGKRLPEIISETLWAPMGAEEDANITIDAIGNSTASGGISATLRDYARFAKLMLDNGKANGKQLIPEWWIEDIRTGPHGLFSEEAKEVFKNGCYRNQFWIEDKQKTTFACLGVFGQTVYVSPEYNMVAVKLSTWPEFLNREFHRDTILAFHAIGKALNS